MLPAAALVAGTFDALVSGRRLLERNYVGRTKPLTTSKPAPPKGQSALLSLITFGKQLRTISLGALVGWAAAIIVQWIKPGHDPISVSGPFAISCMIVGMAAQGLLHYLLGWWVDPRVQHLRASQVLRIELRKIAAAERSGALPRPECDKLRARAHKRSIAGGFKARRRRGPNRPRQPAPAPVPGASPLQRSAA